jgi:hypothetical protein
LFGTATVKKAGHPSKRKKARHPSRQEIERIFASLRSSILCFFYAENTSRQEIQIFFRSAGHPTSQIMHSVSQDGHPNSKAKSQTPNLSISKTHPCLAGHFQDTQHSGHLTSCEQKSLLDTQPAFLDTQPACLHYFFLH